MSTRPTAIEALAANPASAGLVLDFDGVLSPIVADPSTSAMPDLVATALARLAKSLGLLAVMSGRPVAFLADRVRIPGVHLLGSYGIEQIMEDGRLRMDPDAEAWLGEVREAGQALDELLSGSPGIRVEKKSVSVAVHWRQAQDHAAAADEARQAVGRIAAQTGLRREPGKLVEELRPPIAVDKGSAIAALLASKKITIIAYAGDDLGDIPALRAVRKAGGYALVVDHGAETDSRVLELADQTYAGTEGFTAWLTALSAAVDA